MKTKEDQIQMLRALIPNAVTSDRKQGGRSLTYMEGWIVEEALNYIFDHQWDSSISQTQCVREWEYKGKAAMVAAAYRTEVVLTVTWADGTQTTKTGVGNGCGQGRADGGTGWHDAHEGADKEAFTDAMKRAAKQLGRALGNGLYDKEKRYMSRSIDGWWADCLSRSLAREPAPEADTPKEKPVSKKQSATSTRAKAARREAKQERAGVDMEEYKTLLRQACGHADKDDFEDWLGKVGQPFTGKLGDAFAAWQDLFYGHWQGLPFATSYAGDDIDRGKKMLLWCYEQIGEVPMPLPVAAYIKELRGAS